MAKDKFSFNVTLESYEGRGDVVIPKKVSGMAVNRIAESVFSCNTSIAFDRSNALWAKLNPLL